jgi:hypothetical protein
VEDSLGNIAVDSITVVVKAPSNGTLPWLIYAPLPLLLTLILIGRRTRRL